MTTSSVETLPTIAEAPESASLFGLRADLSLIAVLWRRDMIHLLRERSRWLGVVVQPLLFWGLIGSGLAGAFALRDAAGLGYLEYLFPGILAMVVLFTAVFATMSVIEDRQQGFLQQVMVVPGSRAALVLGKTAGVTTMALVQAGLCLLAAPLAGLSLAAVDWPSLILALVLGCVGLTAINFALAWLVDSTAGYHGILSIVLLPLWIVSGAMFPAASGLSWIEPVMRANPMTYLVDAIRHALYGGVAPIGHVSLAFALVVLAGCALAFVALAVVVVGRRVQGGRA
ncbi:ABC transporter permease [Nannocystaceae bacterium ST9]